MIISVSDTNQCWVCGKDNKVITRHHVLPKHLNPLHNIIVPVCEGCHDRINADDINGMYAYLFKIKKEVKNNVNHINVALRKLDSIKEMQEEKCQKKI